MNKTLTAALLLALSAFATTAQAEAGNTGMDMVHDMSDASGGTAPPDARDPHAYADGYILDSGAYALPGPRTLKLADEANFGSLLVDRLERSHSHQGNATRYDAQAWFGRDFDRLVIKAEGEYEGGKLHDSRNELLWGHAFAPYWDLQAGLRRDGGSGPGRSWLAFGVQGLAPYWFEVDATAYVGDNGRTALRFSAEYELLLTQRLILQPRLEFNAYGKDDPRREIGHGLSDSALGLRLRYEFSRQFAPYLGVERSDKWGKSGDMAAADGKPRKETRWVAGLRFWF
ncbi:hypothetical protein DLREEDagrD3_23260 [Denitratisoma sp. agr-D3]